MHNPTLAKKAKLPSNGLTGLPCDRACNANITADRYYSVGA